MKCKIKYCQQQVLDKKEQLKEKPVCYAHAKMRDGLFTSPSDYSFATSEVEFKRVLSNPSNYEKVSENGWDLK